MLVPRFVAGLTRDVKKESLRRIRLMKKGASWAEVMEDELVDVESLPGLVVLDGPSPNLGFELHVHVYSPFHWALDATRSIKAILPRSARSTIFFDAIKTPWGVLGMLGDSTGAWTGPEAHQWPYVQAVERWWDDFEAVGDRYSGGTQNPWPLHTSIGAAYYALCALGLSREDLHTIRPQGYHALYRRLLEVRAAQGLPPPPEAP
jgi:hypothetical protein